MIRWIRRLFIPYRKMWVQDHLRLMNCKQEYMRLLDKLEKTRCDRIDCKNRKVDKEYL